MTSKLTRLTDEELAELAFYAGGSTCHPDPNYQLGFESLATGHSVLSIVRELQERRKAAMDSKPVAYIDKQWTLIYYVPPMSMGLKIGDKLYRHAQPAPETEREPIAWLNDAYLARGVVDGEAGSEDAGPGYIPVYREASPAQSAPVVPDCITPESDIICRVKPEGIILNNRERHIAAEVWNACRAAMIQDGNSPVIGIDPASGPDRTVEVRYVADRWIPVSERMPETDGNYWGWWSESKRQGPVWFIKSELQAQFQSHEITHWMPLPAGPQEAKDDINALISLVSRNEQEVKGE